MAVDVARAWKDVKYRGTLTPEELASLPPNPAGGGLELTDEDLGRVAGGYCMSVGTCADSCVCTIVVGCKTTLPPKKLTF